MDREQMDLVKKFFANNTFKVPIKPVNIRPEHIVFGCPILPGQPEYTIREV